LSTRKATGEATISAETPNATSSVWMTIPRLVPGIVIMPMARPSRMARLIHKQRHVRSRRDRQQENGSEG
jgi:hypothetical protein